MGCAFCDNWGASVCADRVLVFNRDVEREPPVELDPVPYGSEPMFEAWLPSMQCPDCGVAVDNYHHDGCDLELCPHCGDQFTECPCLPGAIKHGQKTTPS